MKREMLIDMIILKTPDAMIAELSRYFGDGGLAQAKGKRAAR